MLEDELQKIYDSEINIEISWLWDGGITVKLGDPMNGYREHTTVRTTADILPWLQRAIAKHYPDSTYIRELGSSAPEPLGETEPPALCVHSCPHCGAVNSFPGWSEMHAYVCRICGEGVCVEPSVQ